VVRYKERDYGRQQISGKGGGRANRGRKKADVKNKLGEIEERDRDSSLKWGRRGAKPNQQAACGLCLKAGKGTQLFTQNQNQERRSYQSVIKKKTKIGYLKEKPNPLYGQGGRGGFLSEKSAKLDWKESSSGRTKT